jgi:hypothetical protein
LQKSVLWAFMQETCQPDPATGFAASAAEITAEIDASGAICTGKKNPATLPRRDALGLARCAR